MAARRRDARKRGWPANLYESRGYFSWRNPCTGETFGLGKDKRAAFEQAVEANLHIAGMADKGRLVDRLTGVASRTWSEWLDAYEQILARRELADNTRKVYRSLLGRVRGWVDASTPIERITTQMIADKLTGYVDEGKARQAQQFRSFLADVFREAIAAGWVASSPVEVTRVARVTVKRSRLTWEVFQQLYTTTRVTWLRNAMALALVSGQRREDIALSRYSDVHDGAWWCEQTKTGTRLCIPLSLRLDVFGMSLDDVIRQCRSTRVLSQHLIHQVRPLGNSPVGSPIWKDTLSRRFADELAKLQLDFGDKEPPTFHEIRSLAERMYRAQGNVDTQSLLGHKDARSTQIYQDTRGAEWTRVVVR